MPYQSDEITQHHAHKLSKYKVVCYFTGEKATLPFLFYDLDGESDTRYH